MNPASTTRTYAPLTNKVLRNTYGLLCVFALTGFMAYTLGPILNTYLSLDNGGQIVMTAMAGTGLIFLGLSGYALASCKTSASWVEKRDGRCQHHRHRQGPTLIPIVETYAHPYTAMSRTMSRQPAVLDTTTT
jgi:hypothetical protein